jgi:glycosyltransferase involved in cell wall biosynthesis
MASGVAVIATRSSAGVTQIIREGVDGLLVPPDSPELLAAAMDSLVRDHRLRGLFASRAGEIVERYSVTKIMNQWEAVLSEALARDVIGDHEI